MRIGIFTDTYPPFINGVSTSIAMLEKGLREKGHDVFIVTVNPENFSYKYENEDRIIRIPGVPTGIYDYRLTGIYSIRALNKIKDWKLDIIHSHTEFGIGTFARIVAKQYNIPLVHTYHTMYEDYVHYITKGYFDKTSKKIVEYLTKFYCDKTARELIVPSTKTYDLFIKKYKIQNRVNIIPTGIDISRFFKENVSLSEVKKIKEDLGIKKNDFILLFVGRLAEEKNVELLINAHNEIIKNHKHVKLMIVGSGPDYEKYINLSISLGIKDNVIFTNAIPWNDIPLYYHVADVFVTASTSETQGLTVIEAMAASLPVICADDEAFNRIVINGTNGFLFSDKDEYINCIDKIIEDKKLLIDESIEARNTSEEHSIDKYADKILKVYNRVIMMSNEEKNKKWYQKIKDKIKGDINE